MTIKRFILSDRFFASACVVASVGILLYSAASLRKSALMYQESSRVYIEAAQKNNEAADKQLQVVARLRGPSPDSVAVDAEMPQLWRLVQSSNDIAGPRDGTLIADMNDYQCPFCKRFFTE